MIFSVPAYRDAAEPTFPRLLAALPFGPERPPWRLPDGCHPERRAMGAPARLAP